MLLLEDKLFCRNRSIPILLIAVCLIVTVLLFGITSEQVDITFDVIHNDICPLRLDETEVV